MISLPLSILPQEHYDQIVFVCGWMDGQLHHVKKYSEFYHSQGYKVYTVLSNGLSFFLPPSLTQATNASLVASSGIGNGQKTIVHAMSNGGLRSWYCLNRELKKLGFELKVQGFVLDSCPMVFRDVALDPLIETSFNFKFDNPIIKHTVSILLSCSLICCYIIARMFNIASPIELNESEFIFNHVPKLFLYSSSDSVVLRGDVELQIARAKRMARVVEYDFNDSLHCAHMKQFKEKYQQLVIEFLDSISR